LSDVPSKPPLEREFNFGRLSDAGEVVVLAPTAAELEALAKWVEVCSVDAFRGTIDLTRKSPSDFHYEASIEADVTQNCVVTLEPVKSHISRHFSRDLHLSRMVRRDPAAVEALASGAGDDEAPEEITSPIYDIAGPVLEEFSLAIDPYPRAPGAAFESVTDPAEQALNPFAVLGRLKSGI
jgi:hypothetical protein